MYKYKGGKYTLKEIFKDVEEEKRNGIKIEYIWLNNCDKCDSVIETHDEEYSFEYINEKKVSYKELEEALKEYNKSYSIYEGLLEEELKRFVYVGLDKSDNTTIYYYYIFDDTNKELCEICEKIWN